MPFSMQFSGKLRVIAIPSEKSLIFAPNLKFLNLDFQSEI